MNPSEAEPKLVVWRFDGMVEPMRKLELESYDQPEDASLYPDPVVRPNLALAFTSLKESGFQVYLHAMGDRSTEMALERAGLKGTYTDILDFHDYRDSTYFPYDHLGQLLDLTPQQLTRRMIAVSGYRSDMPFRNPGLVFIEERDGLEQLVKTDAMSTVEWIKTIDQAGGGDFNQGWVQLYLRAQQVPNTRTMLGQRRLELPSGLEANLGYERCAMHSSDLGFYQWMPRIYWINGPEINQQPTPLTNK